MRYLTKFIEEVNFKRRLFGEAPLLATALTRADIKELKLQIECDLSPENLTCDGELNARTVRARYRMLTNAQAELARLTAYEAVL